VTSSLARAVRASSLLAALAALGLAAWGQKRAAFILTASCAVVIISGLWLERVVRHVLQPGRPRLSRGILWQAVGRLAFLAVAAGVLFLLGSPEDLWPAAAGVTVGVVGWAWAGISGR
jgi:hypothetical protein